MSNTHIPIEKHPLSPFLPQQAKLLMLGSFPPQRKRWSMDFYYPNLNNDMWRIMGYLFFHERDVFLEADKKAFRKEAIVRFLEDRGIALFDTASSIRRLKDNASDKFLEVVERTDVGRLIDALPKCKAICTTGEKATDTLCALFAVNKPLIGNYESFMYKDRPMRLYRMPSSSRAYPLKLEQKADAYRKMMNELEILTI